MTGTGRAWIELDMNNLRHNIKVLKSFLPDRCSIMAVVKANAYGHGLVEMARELNKNGIRSFCVATVQEGVELRKYGIQGEILILGYTHPEQLQLLTRYRLMQTVIDYEYAKTLNCYGSRIAVHIKVDTGMHRLGEPWVNIDNILRIFKFKNLDIKGIYMHLSAVDSDRQANKNFTQKQIDDFYYVLSRIQKQGFALPKVHIQSSYGVFNRPDLSCDYARIGIALYGMLSTFNDTKEYNIGLRPVLSVKARVSAVKTLSAGETVGYGLDYTTHHRMKIAVITIGYADGIPRCLSGGIGYVLINGKKAFVVGRICMDQMIVDVTDIENVMQGDIAVIIGKSGKAEITACELAEKAGTIANEILSRLGTRLERVITRSNRSFRCNSAVRKHA
ncbi:MAG: serine racemase VanT catalytic subunit [Clostridiaceae bacterium]|nr:serine racemase VanT catalytic subunit [Clostridiaceae bacterium]